MSDQHITFSPECNQWTLTDGRHHMEVPGWAREIMRSEFERETRPLRDNLDLALDSKRIAERHVTKLLAENAKLREENERFIIKLNAEHIVRQNVEAENAKLRELLAKAGRLLPLADWTNVRHDEMASEVMYGIDELGIEVD